MQEPASLGNWIKRRRKALDLTQEELAKRVGCSKSLVFKIETDERRPSRQIAELIARHLEIPAEQQDLFLKIARQEKGINSLVSLTPQAEPLPAAAMPPARTGMPAFPTSFFGRATEIEVVVQRLLDPNCRLLTLTGPGGVGKTRLAVEVARRLEPEFPDGVDFISLAGISLPESIIPTVADGLGLVFSGPADPRLQLINVLRNKKSLLLFDNMEHLSDGGELLAEILLQAPDIKLLVTSRTQLQLQWEWIFELQGLPVPQQADEATLAASSGANLFLQRARQAGQDFSLDSADAPALVQILQLVGGLPLAIELAAGWIHILPLEAIARELENSLDLLETSRQDVPARQRSIKSVFEYSWNLLSQEEQIILMRLAAFPGGLTREAAKSIAGASLPLLASLAGKSLLHYQQEKNRYELHELIRQYALGQLQAQPDEEAQTLEKLSRYYADWIAELEAPLKNRQQRQASLQIQAETANWMAAWRWSVQNHRLDLLRQMTPCLYWYYEIHGYYDEALKAFRLAVSELRAAGAPGSLETPEEQSAFAFLVDQNGWFEFRTGAIELAEALFTESLELARLPGDPEVLYYIYGNWGYLALLKGDFEAAKRMTQESLTYAQALDSEWHTAIPANVLGVIELQQGDPGRAYEQLKEVLQIWREVGDPRGLIFCMLYLSSAAFALGELETAQQVLTESNGIARDKSDRWAEAFGLDLLGQAALSGGQPELARDLFQQSLRLSQAIGDKWAANRTRLHLGESLAELGNGPDARQTFLEVYRLAQQAGWTPTMLESLISYAALETECDLEVRLGVARAVQYHPGLTPQLRLRAEALQEQLEPRVEASPPEARSLEDWASELFGQGD